MRRDKSKLKLKQSAYLSIVSVTAVGILAGCGGVTTNQPNLRPTQPQSVVAFGVNATYAVEAGVITEISGLGSADNSTMYDTGAVASTATVQATIQGATGTIPLGFAPAGAAGASGGSVMVPVAPSKTGVIFGAAIANGINTTNNKLYSVVSPALLTSSEVPGFSEAINFTSASSGPMANATYQTAPFTLPFSTSGLHTLRVAVSDDKPETTTTDYKVAVLAPAAGMLFLNAIQIPKDMAGSTAIPIGPGDTVTVTGDLGASEQSTADAFGSIVLFATPGTRTLTYTSANGSVTATQTVTVVAGKEVIQNFTADSTGTIFTFNTTTVPS